MSFRVPVLPVDVTIVCSDGERLMGKVFIPEKASQHTGPMRAEEWVNQDESFFPFLQEGTKKPVILNKSQLLLLTVAAENDPSDLPDDAPIPKRSVSILTSEVRVHGMIVVDMPHNHERILDVLNGNGDFLPVHDGNLHHLVAKRLIVRVIEEGEEAR